MGAGEHDGSGAARAAGEAYDPVRERVVLFGGRTYVGAGTVGLNDTWEWDGASWMKVAEGGPAAPPSSPTPAMAYDEARAQMLMYDSWTGSTWTWSGSAWTRLSDSGLTARNGAQIAYDPQSQRVILFGGYGIADVVHGETWAWNGVSWEQVAADGPAPRSEYLMAYDLGLGRLVLHGGIDRPPPQGQIYGDTWVWDGDAWSPLERPQCLRSG